MVWSYYPVGAHSDMRGRLGLGWVQGGETREKRKSDSWDAPNLVRVIWICGISASTSFAFCFEKGKTNEANFESSCWQQTLNL